MAGANPTRNPDLHGSAPDKCTSALLLIDVINDLEFPGGEKLLPPALKAARQIARLKERARRAGIPVLYVNDNRGRWRSDFKSQVDHCLSGGVRGEPLVRLIAPDPSDYFVLKPKHSGFFSTTLDTLLRYLGTERIILGGFATDLCVLYTANDAYMRDYRLWIPSDCVAAEPPRANRFALELMATHLKADIRPAAKVRSLADRK